MIWNVYVQIEYPKIRKVSTKFEHSRLFSKVNYEYASIEESDIYPDIYVNEIS